MKLSLFFYRPVAIFCSLWCFVLYSCHNNASTLPQTIRVSFSVSSAHNKKVFLERVPYDTEKTRVIDSSVVITAKDSIVFQVPYEPDRQYRIRISDSHRAFNFIADAPYIRIIANDVNGKYTVEGSPASASLKEFTAKQFALNDGLQKIALQLDSMKKKNEGNVLIKQLANMRDSLAGIVVRNNLAFADTVSNAAAFIQAFSGIEFSNRNDDLKHVVNKAAKRFPGSVAVQRLQKDALDMISIYEEEYNVGDSLPAITLPDVSGRKFNTASLKGKYYLIDFWASWYPKTFVFDVVKKKAASAYPQNKLQLVSVALDDNKDSWNNMILSQGLNWIQLIDENMWRGTAAKTLKFDSIPFNFLVNDKGRIVAKAIKPDSLMIVLQKAIK